MPSKRSCLRLFWLFDPPCFFFFFFFFLVSFPRSDDKASPPQEELRRGETPRRRVSSSSNQTARDLFKAHTAPCPAPAIPTSPTRGGHFPSTLSKYRSSTLSTHTPSFRLGVIPSRIRAPFPPVTTRRRAPWGQGLLVCSWTCLDGKERCFRLVIGKPCSLSIFSLPG
ncbi:hypothetical protein BKA81DRAFT_134902 [Phyllosticta paracitricarpa]